MPDLSIPLANPHHQILFEKPPKTPDFTPRNPLRLGLFAEPVRSDLEKPGRLLKRERGHFSSLVA